MPELTEDERRLSARAVHKAFLEAVRADNEEKANVLESARDKLET